MSDPTEPARTRLEEARATLLADLREAKQRLTAAIDRLSGPAAPRERPPPPPEPGDGEG